MKVSLVCLPCIVDDIMSAASLVEKDEGKQARIAKEVARFLSSTYREKKEPSFYITEVHRILKHVSGEDMPFREKRRASNLLGLKIAQRLVLPRDERERFFFLVRAAVCANHVDYRTAGAGYEKSLKDTESMLLFELEKGLSIDESEKIFHKVRSSRNVLYVCDNVGEIAIDKLLISEIGKYTRVVAALRGGPITSDAIIEDGKFVGMDEACPLIVAGPDTLGISFNEMSEELKDAMKEADLIITKGQANFYVMEEHKDEIKASIACLFSSKCDYVSSFFKLEGKVNLAVVLKD